MAVCDSMLLQRPVPVPVVAVVAPHGPQLAAQAVGHAVSVVGRAGVGSWWMAAGMELMLSGIGGLAEKSC